MSKNKQVIDQNYLSDLLEIQTEYDALVNAYGQLQIEQNTLNDRKAELDEEWQKIKIKQQILFNALSEKYGTGQVDLKSGIFVSES